MPKSNIFTFSPSEKKDLFRVVQLKDPQAIQDRVSILLSFYNSYYVLVALKEALLTLPLARQWKVANLLWDVSARFAQDLCRELLKAYLDRRKTAQKYYHCDGNIIVLHSNGYAAYLDFCLKVSGNEYMKLDYVVHDTGLYQNLHDLGLRLSLQLRQLT